MSTLDPQASDALSPDQLDELGDDLTLRAQRASHQLAGSTGQQRRDALLAMAQAMRQQSASIQQANVDDLKTARDMGLSEAMIDRLTLDDARVEKMARSVEQIAQQVDPVGQVIEGFVRPNGLRLQKVRVPLGVVLIIFESRPNVTSDAAALCVKSGNAVILRGGKEALHSNRAIAQAVRAGMTRAGVPEDAVQLVPSTDRQLVGHLLRASDRIDVAIPRGGESLIRAVVEQAHIPVIKHYTGNCHVYVDASAQPGMARDIVINAKTQRPGVCNAAETILLHRHCVESGLAKDIVSDLIHAGVQVRGDHATQSLHEKVTPATEQDWAAEYLDQIVAVRVVEELDQAVEHINQYGSKHTDAIVTESVTRAQQFVQHVDSGNVFINCSTRFSDGGEYGLGAEIGISTDKLHARGPMGAADLTTYKWVAYGSGQIRT